jgi:hypothetical protein
MANGAQVESSMNLTGEYLLPQDKRGAKHLVATVEDEDDVGFTVNTNSFFARLILWLNRRPADEELTNQKVREE